LDGFDINKREINLKKSKRSISSPGSIFKNIYLEKGSNNNTVFIGKQRNPGKTREGKRIQSFQVSRLRQTGGQIKYDTIGKVTGRIDSLVFVCVWPISHIYIL
jgi:hypothetical protein